MSPIHETAPARPRYRRLLRGPTILLAVVVLGRFALEAAGLPLDATRFLSANVLGALAIIYVGAVAPLCGVTRFRQLAFPAFILSAGLGGWTALTLLVSGLLHLPGSHFAHVSGSLYPRLWFHVFEHVAVIPFASLATLGMMAIPYFLRRWPVTVAPATVLGGLVILRFAAEAMDLAPTTASSLSPGVGLVLCALYLGGIGPRMGLTSPQRFLAPALALGLVWRLWIFLAALVSVVLGYKSHFFDPSEGRVVLRLLEFLAGEVIGVGLAAGLLVLAIASWASRATRPLGEA